MSKMLAIGDEYAYVCILLEHWNVAVKYLYQTDVHLCGRRQMVPSFEYFR